MVQHYPRLTSTLDRWVGNATPCRSTNGKEIRYIRYRRLGGPQKYGEEKISCNPPGIEPQTVEALVSRYADYAVPALFQTCYIIKMEMEIQLQNGLQNGYFK